MRKMAVDKVFSKGFSFLYLLFTVRYNLLTENAQRLCSVGILPIFPETAPFPATMSKEAKDRHTPQKEALHP